MKTENLNGYSDLARGSKAFKTPKRIAKVTFFVLDGIIDYSYNQISSSKNKY